MLNNQKSLRYQYFRRVSHQPPPPAAREWGRKEARKLPYTVTTVTLFTPPTHSVHKPPCSPHIHFPLLNHQPPPSTSTLNMTSTSNAIPQAAIIDDKTPHILPFILHYLSLHQKTHPTRPFIIGLNGIQGAGKTTLVNTLYEILTRDHGLETLVLSIDDLYLTRADQEKLARENEGNKLVQYRGEPGIYLSIYLLYP